MILEVNVTSQDIRLGKRGATPVERAINRALKKTFPKRNLWSTVQADFDGDLYIKEGRKKLTPVSQGYPRWDISKTIFTGEILNSVAANHNWCWERRFDNYARAIQFKESGLLYKPFRFIQEIPYL